MVLSLLMLPFAMFGFASGECLVAGWCYSVVELKAAFGQVLYHLQLLANFAKSGAVWELSTELM